MARSKSLRELVGHIAGRSESDRLREPLRRQRQAVRPAGVIRVAAPFARPAVSERRDRAKDHAPRPPRVSSVR